MIDWIAGRKRKEYNNKFNVIMKTLYNLISNASFNGSTNENQKALDKFFKNIDNLSLEEEENKDIELANEELEGVKIL